MKILGSKPSKKAPIPSIPPIDPATQRQKLGRLHWIRAGFGALSGVISGILFPPTILNGIIVPNPNALYGFYIAVFVFIGTYYLAKYYILKGLAQKDRNKLFTQGIGSFIMMFIFVWIIFTTYNYCLIAGTCHI